MSTETEARTLAGVIAVITGTGLAGSVFPAAESAITIAVVVAAVLALAARLIWWRFREYRADRADALAAAAARTAYESRRSFTAAGADRRAA
jgi:predicted lipid-binding transport protein (Tim44 family)